ncbi:MAG: DNA alkylation repair protein [Phycisphaerales bacterium]|nr:DNA alkylation repair protein [Phycisphaerales bacterium]MCI0630794.1 DNA alkylation repair protein [Phycisphaerales bacterium]MCI0674218.1 DNA alkylation repair protein [Phycisphaerales bacterium]
MPTATATKIPTAQEVLKEIKPWGKDSYKKTMMSHGIEEPIYGVKIEDLKKIQKRVKKNYQLALDLYDTGVYDAKYLAGLIADETKMTKKDLQRWLDKAGNAMLCEFTVPWVAAESNHGWELALEWIESKKEHVAAAGWCTISSLLAIKEDSELDLAHIKKLLQRVQKTIHDQPNRVRQVMNAFIIAVGGSVKSLTADAIAAAKAVGTVTVDMHGTACKTPDAAEYINKVKERGSLGKKRKTCRC